MTSDQFVRWLEGKLDKHGVTKVVPGKKTLEDAWRRARVPAKVKAAVLKIRMEPDTEPMPANLDKRFAQATGLRTSTFLGSGTGPHCWETSMTQRTSPVLENRYAEVSETNASMTTLNRTQA